MLNNETAFPRTRLFFDLETQQINARFDPDHPEHYLDYLSIGELQGYGSGRELLVTNPNGYLFTESLGCSGSLPESVGAGFEIYFGNGGCSGSILDWDEGGRESLSVTLQSVSAVATPNSFLLYGSALLLLMRLNRKSKSLDQ